MKNARQRLPFKEIVRPERRDASVRGNYAAAEESHPWPARPDACPSPTAHVKGPIAPRFGFRIADLKACTGGARRRNENAICTPVAARNEFVRTAANGFSREYRETLDVAWSA